MKNIFEQVIEIEEKTYSLKNVVLKITLISIWNKSNNAFYLSIEYVMQIQKNY